MGNLGDSVGAPGNNQVSGRLASAEKSVGNEDAGQGVR